MSSDQVAYAAERSRIEKAATTSVQGVDTSRAPFRGSYSGRHCAVTDLATR